MLVTITGKPTGDCECWCFEVTEDEYRRIVGEDMYQIDKHFREQMKNDPQALEWSGKIREGEERYTIYPNDIMRALGVYNDDKVTLEIRRVDDANAD